MALVSDAIDRQQHRPKHPRDMVSGNDDSFNDAPGPKILRPSKTKRKSMRTRAQRENEEATIELNGDHTSIDSHQHRHSVPVGIREAAAIAGGDQALPSIENDNAQLEGRRKGLSDYEAGASDQDIMTIRLSRREFMRAPSQYTLASSGSLSVEDGEVVTEKQRESNTGVETVNQAYATVDSILARGYEQERASYMVELREQWRLFEDVRAVNRRITREKMDAFWVLMDRSKAPEAGR